MVSWNDDIRGRNKFRTSSFDELAPGFGRSRIHGPDELRADYKRREAREQHADFGMARRFLRMAMCLMRTHQSSYLPKRMRSQQCKMEERARYYHKAWPLIMDKWRRVRMLDVAFDKKMAMA